MRPLEITLQPLLAVDTTSSAYRTGYIAGQVILGIIVLIVVIKVVQRLRDR
jgi:hypothetical protein